MKCIIIIIVFLIWYTVAIIVQILFIGEKL
jgi:hypothetical protein